MNAREARTKRLLEWFSTPHRQPSNIAFTDGLDRYVASMMEYAERHENEKHYK